MNKIILCGNLCKDVESKYYNDRKVIRNTIAVRRDFKNKEGNYDSDFINFTVWGNQAEYIEKYAQKGDKVIICGKLQNNNYESNGQTVYSDVVQVENIELLTSKKNNNDVVQQVRDTLGDDVAIEVINDKNLLD